MAGSAGRSCQLCPWRWEGKAEPRKGRERWVGVTSPGARAAAGGRMGGWMGAQRGQRPDVWSGTLEMRDSRDGRETMGLVTYSG